VPPRRRKPKHAPIDLGDPGLDPGCQGTPVERALDARLRREGYTFDPAAADRVCRFFEEDLRHVANEWQGRPIILAPWERRVIRRLFGWKRPNGTRRYRRCHIWIPKKNGKSLLIAGICLYMLVCDGELTPMVFACAGSTDQADRQLFSVAKDMVTTSPLLDEACTCFASSVFCQGNGGRMDVISSKPGTKHGANVHCVAYDEIHAARDGELYSVMTMGSGAARRQPLELVISTAGDDLSSIGYQLWEYGCKVRDGVLEDPEFLVLIYAADPEDDWRDPEVWARCNPGYPEAPTHDSFVSDMLKASGMPSEVPKFKQLRLNIWVQAATAAIDLAKWRRCARKELARKRGQLVPTAFQGRRCWGGLDLSSTRDLTSFALVFPREGNFGGADVLAWHWVPEDNVAERAKQDRVDYPLWIAQGHLMATPGNVVDYSFIEKFIVDVSRLVDLQDIGYDPRNATDLVQRLQDNHAISVVEVIPGFKNLSPPTKELERLYMSRRLGHSGCPLLTWQASHVVWRKNSTGDIMPDKLKSREKIDGIAALVTALARASLGQADVSILETQGLPTL
jgi:phage terminase large subunit-like protein